MNPLRSLAPRLSASLALAVVVGASLFAAPQAVLAQRVQDVPSSAAAATHQSVPVTGLPAAAPAAAGAPVKGPGKTAPVKPLTPAQQAAQQAELQKYIQAVEAQQAAQTPKSPIAQRFPWLTHIFAGIFLVAAVGLVVLLAFQTTKQEGLSGTIGGRVEAAYRPRLGFDQQLQRVTSVAAITMVIFGTIVSLTGI